MRRIRSVITFLVAQYRRLQWFLQVRRRVRMISSSASFDLAVIRSEKFAIVDETPMTRPLGCGPNIALARELGANPEKELADFMRLHGLTHRQETWAGIDLNGELITDLSKID